MKEEGFFITMDVVFAIVISLATLVVVNQTLQTGQADVWRDDMHQKMAQDVLLVLEKNGTFDAVATMDEDAGEDRVKGALDDILPENMAANVTLTIYDDEDDDDTFEKRDNNPVYSTVSPSGWEQNEYTTAKRVWTDIADEVTDSEFGVARIRLWTVV